MRQFIGYFWGTIAYPRTTFDKLATERTVRWALILACLPVLQVWGNIALHALFGLDWLGTRPTLSNPTFIAGFGNLRIDLAAWVPVFAGMMPFLALINLAILPGLAHLICKLWGGQGTFEQMVNGLTFSATIPSLVIGAVSEWIFGVPADLISGNGYWWTAAMQGHFGLVTGVLWNAYVFAVYIGLQWIWIIVLGSIAIRRVQRIPPWAAALVMLVTFAISMFLSSIFVR